MHGAAENMLGTAENMHVMAESKLDHTPNHNDMVSRMRGQLHACAALKVVSRQAIFDLIFRAMIDLRCLYANLSYGRAAVSHLN